MEEGQSHGPGAPNLFLRALGLGVVGAAIAFVMVPLQGGRNCRQGIADHQPQIADGYAFERAFPTRLLDDHWVTGFLAKPKVGGGELVTVVCHFAGNNFIFDRVEVLDGDRRAQIREVSRSLLNPLVALSR